MSMTCCICGKKLNIFSDYTQITIEGKKKEICAKCNRERERKKIDQLLQTDEGKQKVSKKGYTLIVTGIFEIGLSIFIFTIMSLAALIILSFGIYSIYKGISFKKKVKRN